MTLVIKIPAEFYHRGYAAPEKKLPSRPQLSLLSNVARPLPVAPGMGAQRLCHGPLVKVQKILLRPVRPCRRLLATLPALESGYAATASPLPEAPAGSVIIQGGKA